MRETVTIKPAAYHRLFAAGVALLGIVPAAQAGHLGNGAQQRNQIGVNKCLAMPHDKMMGDQACKSMMTVHPELFPAGTVPPKPNKP